MRTIPGDNPDANAPQQGQGQEGPNGAQEAKQEQKQEGQKAKNTAKKAGKKIYNWILKHKEWIMSHITVIGYGLLIILAIIFIVGIISFLFNMPGMVFSQMIEAAKSFWTRAWGGTVSFIAGDTTTPYISNDDTLELAKYLENMGYNIVGYGFGDVKYSKNDPNVNGSTKEIEKVVAIDQEGGNRNYLQAYLAANESSYQLAKYSLWGELQADTHTFKDVAVTLANITSKVNPIAALIGTSLLQDQHVTSADDFSTGMIDILGVKGSDVGPWTLDLINQETRVKIDRINEKMVISEHAFPNIFESVWTWFTGRGSQASRAWAMWGAQFSFDLSDWTSIYGRPLELFIAMHVGTMMPDLTYDLATGKDFNTKVRIVLEDVKATYTDVMINGSTTNTLEIMRAYLKYCLGDETDEEEETGDDFDETDGVSQTELLEILLNECEAHGEAYVKAFFAMVMQKTSGIHWFGAPLSVKLKKVIKALDWDFLTDKYDSIKKKPKVKLELKEDDDYACTVAGTELTHNQLKDLAEIALNGIDIKEFEVAGIEVRDNWWEFWDSGTYFDTDKLGLQTALPTISSVRKHWFYYDFYFTYTTPEKGQGVYNTTKYATKRIKYTNDDEKSTLKDFEIYIQALFEAIDEDNPVIYYQVNEPYAKGPKPETVDLFRKQYYRYDGTPETARNIAIAKKIDKGKGANYNFKFEDEEYKITADDVEKHANKDLAPYGYPSFGTASDALSAFAILENVKTPAADAVYRMLKELLTSNELQYFTREELEEDLTQVLVWPIKDENTRSINDWTIERDPASYGLIIKNEKGKEVIAPGDGQIISGSGEEVKIKYSSLRDETIEWLEKYYKGDFYKITKDEVKNMVMTISGIKATKTSGSVQRDDTIGTATEEVKIYFEHDDKTVVGGEEDTVDDNIEDYIYPNYTYNEDTIEEETHEIAYGGEIIPEDTDDAEVYDPNREVGPDDNIYDEDQLLAIYAVVHLETSGRKPYMGALAVITCIENRVDTAGFPNDAYSVISAPGQFSTFGTDAFWDLVHHPEKIADTVKQAVDDCMQNGTRNHRYLFFRSNRTSDSYIKSTGEYKKYGGGPEMIEPGTGNKFFGLMPGTTPGSGGGSDVVPVDGDGYVGIYTASNGRTYKYYKQAWYANNPRYNTTQADTDASQEIKRAGCGICSESIILSGFGVDQTPWDTYHDTGINFGYQLPQAGSVRTTGFRSALSDAKTVIPNGGAVILHFNKVGWASDRSASGKSPSHYVAVVDYKREGGQDYYYVLNPAGGRDGWVTFDGSESTSGSCRIIGG